MNERTAPRSIEQYLAALRAALAGEDPALVQDALYDAEEYLRAEVAAHAGKSEADVLELIAGTYGAPDEVAAAYRETEVKVKAALRTPPTRPRRENPGAPRVRVTGPRHAGHFRTRRCRRRCCGRASTRGRGRQPSACSG